jgi:hypothetical protein
MVQVQENFRNKIRRWCDSHQRAALYDDEKSTLLDVKSVKTVKIQCAELKAFEEKVHPETEDVYLVLLFESGKQIALVDPGGVAFAPSTVNSGPVENLPPVVCLGDFLTLKQQVDHYLHDHPDDLPPRECLNMVMICIAILDGARDVGFEVGDFEGELEAALDEIDRKKG